ncbi:MAG: hypothetical protein IIC64_12780 [SAR324 cluster bacterium]|nr:hypothetical protein [SAR324 cluster bacterium]
MKKFQLFSYPIDLPIFSEGSSEENQKGNFQGRHYGSNRDRSLPVAHDGAWFLKKAFCYNVWFLIFNEWPRRNGEELNHKKFSRKDSTGNVFSLAGL